MDMACYGKLSQQNGLIYRFEFTILGKYDNQLYFLEISIYVFRVRKNHYDDDEACLV